MIAQTKVRDYLSFSAIRAYQGCPLRYKFKYLDGIPEDRVSSTLIFGCAIHAALEHHFHRIMAGEPNETEVADLLEVYHQNWSTEKTIQFATKDSRESLDKLAEKMFRNFLTSELSCPAETIVGIEEEFRGTLIPGVPDLLGRIDLLLLGEDVVIRDLKTSRSSWDDEQASESAEQLLLYAELIKEIFPGRTLRLQFAVITKHVDPRIQLVETPWDQHRLERTKQIVKNVWQSIQSGNFYPSPSPIGCSSCCYRSQCLAWKGI
jgi:ATP-dependent exoDNAse (exonuclease V) beta subunit